MVDKSAREIFVKNMRKYMAEKGISQSDIALHMGLTASTVSDWYNGKNYPRVDAMQRLAAYFGVSMRELTTEQDNELDNVLVDLLVRLTPQEVQRVQDFVAGLIASRKV